MKIETIEEKIEDICCDLQEGATLTEKGQKKLDRYTRLLGEKLLADKETKEEK